MSVYADASFLVALLVPDRFTDRAEIFLRDRQPTILVSDFGAAEFASAVGRRVRTGELSASQAHGAFAAFDGWAARLGPRLEVIARDVIVAEAFLRRLELGLRTPDALHLAITQRHEAALATFDVRMAEAARGLGIEIAPA